MNRVQNLLRIKWLLSPSNLPSQSLLMNDRDQPDETQEEFDDLIGPDPGVASMRAINEVDPKQILHFVTTIKNAEQQVGEHILKALQHGDTVAVLTTVVLGPDGTQRIVSAALDPTRMSQVNEILQSAQRERQEQEPCFGFHCLVKPKRLT